MKRSSSAWTRASRKALTLRRATGGPGLAASALGLAVAALAPAPLAAQSLYGCRDLASAQTPAIEGRQGVFFRIDPDLLTYNRFSDEVVAAIGTLAAGLAERGTTLIVVPVPTKALAMPDDLGPDTAAYGYDPALAAAIYDDTLARLGAAGVTALDARRALRNAVSGETTFFRTDRRLTNAGLFALARGIAGGLKDSPLDTAAYKTEPTGALTLSSQDRLNLQMHCLTPLPEVTTMRYETVRQDPAGTDAAAPVVVVGTELTGTPDLNFAGFLSELTGLEVSAQGPSRDPVAAMSAYLTSDTFRQTPPDLLVWEVPSWANLGLYGDQPLRELAAAARDDCDRDLAVTRTGDGRISVDLAGIPHEGGLSLRLETGAKAARADFHFVSTRGEQRTRPVVRTGDQPRTGRFYMPLTGLWAEGSARVEIETEIDPDTLPTVALCRG